MSLIRRDIILALLVIAAFFVGAFYGELKLKKEKAEFREALLELRVSCHDIRIFDNQGDLSLDTILLERMNEMKTDRDWALLAGFLAKRLEREVFAAEKYAPIRESEIEKQRLIEKIKEAKQHIEKAKKRVDLSNKELLY